MIREGINRCTIKGEILHIYEHPYNGSVVVTIGTSGNKPNVVFLNKIAEQLKAGYNVGDFILVEGNIQSSYSYAKGIRISIIADNILPLSSTPNRYENHFEVYGTIKSIVKFGKMHKVNVNTVSNGYVSTVPITFNYYSNCLNFEKSESLRVSGVIATSSKEVNGRMKYYQNYVANGIL